MIKILASVRVGNAVYMPDNDEHAEDLNDVLNDKQRERLTAAGAIVEKAARKKRKASKPDPEVVAEALAEPANPFEKKG